MTDNVTDISRARRRIRPLTEGGKYEEFAEGFEQQLVYQCCTNPRVWGAVGQHLDPALMKDDRAGAVIKACREIARNTGEPPTSVDLVVQHLKSVRDDGKLRAETLARVLTIFDDGEDRDAKATSADQIIAAAASVLRARESASVVQAIQVAHGKGEDITEFVAELDAISSIGRVSSVDAADLDAGLINVLRRDANRKRLPLGIAALDDAMGGGMRTGTIHVWGAPSGVGKTAAMVHQACFNLLSGRRIIYVPLEEGVPDVAARFAAWLTATPIDHVGKLDHIDDVDRRYTDVLRIAGMGSLAIRGMAPGATVAQLRRMLDELVRRDRRYRDGWDMLFVDYPDKMALPGGRDVGTYEKMGTIYDDLRNIGVEHKNGVVVGSQLKGFDKEPELEDLRGSRLKGDVADSVVLIWRDSDVPEERHYKIAKHRGAGAGTRHGPYPLDEENGRLVVVSDSRVEPEGALDDW